MLVLFPLINNPTNSKKILEFDMRTSFTETKLQPQTYRIENRMAHELISGLCLKLPTYLYYCYYYLPSESGSQACIVTNNPL